MAINAAQYEVRITINAYEMVEATDGYSAIDRAKAIIMEKHPELFATENDFHISYDVVLVKIV